jgi:hypothetical protein
MWACHDVSELNECQNSFANNGGINSIMKNKAILITGGTTDIGLCAKADGRASIFEEEGRVPREREEVNAREPHNKLISTNPQFLL